MIKLFVDIDALLTDTPLAPLVPLVPLVPLTLPTSTVDVLLNVSIKLPLPFTVPDDTLTPILP